MGTDKAGTLQVVATPIGNLEDLTPRAARVLREADLVLAEDTRRTGKLLAHIDSHAPQRSLHEHNEQHRLDEVLELLGEGANVALVSDAGTPAVSDPGYRLLAACADAGVRIEPIPGPSAVLAALVTSGLPTDRVAFDGFLPRKGALRRQRLDEIAAETRTVVLFVSPHRAAADLRDLATVCGSDRPAVLARELTKLHEEIRRGTLGTLQEAVEQVRPRGELTLVIAGAVTAAPVELDVSEAADQVLALVAAGTRKKDAIAEVARAGGLPKRDVYDAVVAAEAATT